MSCVRLMLAATADPDGRGYRKDKCPSHRRLPIWLSQHCQTTRGRRCENHIRQHCASEWDNIDRGQRRGQWPQNRQIPARPQAATYATGTGLSEEEKAAAEKAADEAAASLLAEEEEVAASSTKGKGKSSKKGESEGESAA